MLPLFLALAQIVITGPPPPGPPPSRAQHGIFSGYDYPSEAVRNRWEGTVVVDLLVSGDGSPKSCSILKSSGHQLLDDTTCNLIMTRAKFIAAKDKAGNAVESRYRPPSVEWRLKE
jgi:periplasmic protein TonB